MKPTTNCTTTIYKSLVAFIFMLFRYHDQNFVYMHFFHEKREKSSLMIVIKNVPFYRIFETLFNSMYKGKFMVTPFHPKCIILYYIFSCFSSHGCITNTSTLKFDLFRKIIAEFKKGINFVLQVDQNTNLFHSQMTK